MESATLTVSEASSEIWQKGDQSVTKGGAQLQEIILQALQDNRGALIGRHGTIELSMTLSTEFKGAPDMSHASTLEKNAGIFPKTSSAIRQWASAYKEAAEQADVMAVCWFKPLATLEWVYMDKINTGAKRIPLRALEPYYTQTPWISSLSGKKVAVVSSFAETMKSQSQRFDKIWSDPMSHLLAKADWSFVRSYYSPALAKGKCEWPESVQSWEAAVDYLEERVMESGAQVALLGCGGLAMPLASRLKKKGIIAIVMGGSIQVLFGIRGRRWEHHPVISKFYNNAWVYPSDEEVPRGANEVEGGCYW
jgi:hypothetical protein